MDPSNPIVIHDDRKPEDEFRLNDEDYKKMLQLQGTQHHGFAETFEGFFTWQWVDAYGSQVAVPKLPTAAEKRQPLFYKLGTKPLTLDLEPGEVKEVVKGEIGQANSHAPAQPNATSAGVLDRMIKGTAMAIKRDAPTTGALSHTNVAAVDEDKKNRLPTSTVMAQAGGRGRIERARTRSRSPYRGSYYRPEPPHRARSPFWTRQWHHQLDRQLNATHPSVPDPPRGRQVNCSIPGLLAPRETSPEIFDFIARHIQAEQRLTSLDLQKVFATLKEAYASLKSLYHMSLRDMLNNLHPCMSQFTNHKWTCVEILQRQASCASLHSFVAILWWALVGTLKWPALSRGGRDRAVPATMDIGLKEPMAGRNLCASWTGRGFTGGVVDFGYGHKSCLTRVEAQQKVRATRGLGESKVHSLYLVEVCVIRKFQEMSSMNRQVWLPAVQALGITQDELNARRC